MRRPDGQPDTRSQASLAGVLAASGRRADAEKSIRAVIDSGYMDHHVAYALGAAQAQLGRPTDAVKWLRAAADTGFACYQWMERDTLLDPIRADQGSRPSSPCCARITRARARATKPLRECPDPASAAHVQPHAAGRGGVLSLMSYSRSLTPAYA